MMDERAEIARLRAALEAVANEAAAAPSALCATEQMVRFENIARLCRKALAPDTAGADGR